MKIMILFENYKSKFFEVYNIQQPFLDIYIRNLMHVENVEVEIVVHFLKDLDRLRERSLL